MFVYSEYILKILITLLVLVCGYAIFSKKLQKLRRTWIVVAILVCAIFAQITSSWGPTLTDQVTLTALGEKCPEADADEVVLAGFTVDGKQYDAGEDLVVLLGHWFWRGESYSWRNEVDIRQPAGVTRTIEIKIPVGVERTLEFQGDIWRGLVKITSPQSVQVFDTYAEYSQVVSVSIGSSQTHMLVLDQLCRVALFALLLLGLTVSVIQIAQYSFQRPDKAKGWLGRHSGKLIYGGLALVVFALMLHYADSASLWNDELYHASVVGNVLQAIMNCLNMYDISPPLYGICAAIWYLIAPYGEQWLLLLSIVPTVIAVYVMGLIGERLRGRNCGVLAASLFGFSLTVWGYAAFEFRPYAFALFFCTLSLYFHVQRNTAENGSRWVPLYSVALTGLCMSHYFGMLACGLFFGGDMTLAIQKKVSWKRMMLSYALPGLVCVIWLGAIYMSVLKYRGTETIATWYGIPALASVESLLHFLTGYFNIAFWLAVFGLAGGLVCTWCLLVQKERWSWGQIYQVFALGVVVITIATLFLYGNFINTTSTMWQERYFMFLIPFITILSSLTVCESFSQKCPKWDRRESVVVLWLVLLLAANCVVGATTCGVTYQPYRQAADWLYTQSDTIFNSDTVIIATISFEKGWEDYYIERRGRRDALNVVNQYACTPETLDSYNRIYVQYTHIAVSEWLQTYLDENFTLEFDDTSIQMRSYVRK